MASSMLPTTLHFAGNSSYNLPRSDRYNKDMLCPGQEVG